jgi:pectinesterase
MNPDKTIRCFLGLLLALIAGAGCQAVGPGKPADASITPTNLVVAADGSGQFRTVQEAIMAVPAGSVTNPVVIHIKPGVYRELVYIQREKRFFRLVGDGADNTVLTFNLSASMLGLDGKKIGTFRTPSTLIDADDFTAENITFENSSGTNGQALAIRVDGDRAVFKNCQFLGWQDTILLNRGRQYFTNCYIEGHVDFIFGAATAFFDHCHIYAKANGYLTAASTPDNQPYGFIFDHCTITGAPGTLTFLGRPWRIYASTVFLNTDMSEVVRPEGWYDWKKPEAHQTARYAEFNNTGPGANPATRPGWTRQLTPYQAADYSRKNVLRGTDGWNPAD